MEPSTNAAFAQIGTLAVHYGVSLAGAILLLVGGFMLAGLLSRWAYMAVSRIDGVDETLSRFLSNALHYGLLVLVFVMVLGQFGVQTTSIVAALGAAGLAIGLALQGTLQNIAAGIMLLVLRPFRVGEYIETASVTGRIVQIGLFATELRTRDGLYLLAPNSTLWNTPIINHSREPERRQQLALAVGPSVDLDGVKCRLLELVTSDKRVRRDPAPLVYADDLGGDQTTLKIEYWVPTACWSETRHDMIERVRSRLAEGQVIDKPEA